MAHYASTVFKSQDPLQPIAVLLLIENSKNMSAIWSDLRDQYLRRLLDSLVAANPGAPVAVTILETSACNHGSPRSSPRPYLDTHQGLYAINFDFAPENRVSPGKIDACINYLDTAKYSGQLCTARHLIVAAATAPSDDSTGMLISEDYSPWYSLSSKLAAKNVYFHIVVSPQQDMGRLTMLFEETLRLQNNIEDVPPFAVDPLRMVCRLSARQNYQPFTEPESSPSFPPQRMPAPPRRNSFPLDNFYAESFDDPSHPNEADSPSLVSQLQQVHGLTKKKVYGIKPPRQPFVRDERINVNANASVRDKYRSKVPPAPLTMPLTMGEQIPSPTAGGRTMSASRADRMNRLSQGGSPTDLHSTSRARQLGWPPRRGSRLSTPEPDGGGGSGGANMSSPASTSTTFTDTSPGSSYVSSDISSPVTPGTSVEELYGHGHPGGPMVGVYQTGGMPDPSWPQHPAQQQHPHAHPHSQMHGQPHQHPHQHPQYHGGYTTATSTYFPPVPQFFTETGHVVGTVEMVPTQMAGQGGQGGQSQQAGPQHAVPGGANPMQANVYGGGAPYANVNPNSNAMSVSPPPIVPSQAPLTASPASAVEKIPTSVSAGRASLSHSHQHPHSHAPHTPRSHAKKPTTMPDDDEERFTFGKEFVAATAALFEAEVLPAYPNFPGMRSGLSEAPMPDTLIASEAGELYASRKRVGRMGMGQGQMQSQNQQVQQQQQQQNQTLEMHQQGAPMTGVATSYELGHPHPMSNGHPHAHLQGHVQAPPMAMSMSAPMSIAHQHPQPYPQGYGLPPPPPMASMNGRAAYASYPAPPAGYPPNYGSSLTGWAG